MAATERFQFAKATVTSETLVENGVVLCFVDVITPEGFPDVSIGWDPKWQRFGVYVDGDEVFPPGDGDVNVHETVNDADAARSTSA